MLACFDTAEYCLSKMEKDAGNATSSPTSLVCYAQDFSITLYGLPLFAELIEAWQHGPLCPASSTPESSTTRLPL